MPNPRGALATVPVVGARQRVLSAVVEDGHIDALIVNDLLELFANFVFGNGHDKDPNPVDGLARKKAGDATMDAARCRVKGFR